MSWHITISPTTVEEMSSEDWVGETVEKHVINITASNPEALEPNGDGSMAVFDAVFAVHFMAQSGVFGSPDKYVAGHVAGHANTNHEPRRGYSNDDIDIHITQIRDPSLQASASEAEQAVNETVGHRASRA